MLLFPIALLVGAAIGLTLGGRFAALGSMHLRWAGLLVGSLILQTGAQVAGAGFERNWGGFVVLVVSYLAGGLWVGVNVRSRARNLQIALVVMGIGWAANGTVVVLNGGMPVSASALRRIGVNPRLALSAGGPFGKHVGLTGRTLLGDLGDVLPVQWLHSVVSPGDIVLLIGVVIFIAAAMKGAVSMSHVPAA